MTEREVRTGGQTDGRMDGRTNGRTVRRVARVVHFIRLTSKTWEYNIKLFLAVVINVS
jgi:hypothetical protein